LIFTFKKLNKWLKKQGKLKRVFCILESFSRPDAPDMAKEKPYDAGSLTDQVRAKA
jgi:hypothetical protein